MDPRRKKIYIIIIIVCFTLSAGLLFWTYFLNGGASTDTLTADQALPNIIPSDAVASQASGDPSVGFRAPAVFPITDAFGKDILESPAFKKLKPYKAVDVAGQLGRPDPFRSY